VNTGLASFACGYALRYALDHPTIGSVTSIGRRKLGILHLKLTQFLHQDFAVGSTPEGVLSHQDATIFCPGTYTGTVADAEIRTIDVDYTVEFARVPRGSSPDPAFSFLSGNGAEPTGRKRVAFARYKGEAEKALLAAGFRYVYLFRSAYIYPVEPRQEPNLDYRLLRGVYPVFRLLFPNQVIRSDELAQVMVDVAVHGTDENVGPVLIIATFEPWTM
jgi:uncharacterized protein YbjT (DUF2867 family)